MMRNVVGRTAARATALALVALAAIPSVAHAVPERKTYLAVISPATVGAGQTVEYSFTVTNPAQSGQSLGSINVTAPPDFTLMAVTQQPQRASDGAFVGSASVASSSLLEIRSLSLAPADSSTVKFTAQAPCVQASGANEWGLAAKQSNDFNGSGNDFAAAASSQRTTDVTGVCQLGWVTQPKDAKKDQAITGTMYDAVDGSVDGPSIKVEVLSAPYADTSRSRVTFSSAQVALEIGDDPNEPDASATLSGTTSATAASGLATFAPGPRIDLHGLDYTLVATNASMASGESGQFNVSDSAGDCSKGQCANLGASGTTVNTKLSSTSDTGVIAISIGVLDALACAGYSASPGQEVVSIFPLGVSSDSTMTIEITVLASVVDRAASQYRVCWASTVNFTERDGTQAEAVSIAGEAMFQGLLPDCAKRNPVAPCQIVPSKQDKQGNVILKVLAPGNDPHAR